MIIDSFDNSKPFITAETLYGEQKVDLNDIITIVTFKEATLEYVKKTYHAEVCCRYKTTNGEQLIYKFKYKDKDYQFYVTPIGAALASTVMNEVMVVTGSHRFIYFGSCGVLSEASCRGKVIIPSSSYRDEGISYHYLPASDYVEIRNASTIEKILKENDIPCVKGQIWTTDAIYMETINKVNKHKKEGCIAVEMEVSGVEAVARYLKIDNYHILFSADSLDHVEKWDRYNFTGDKEVELQIKACEVALLVASKL